MGSEPDSGLVCDDCGGTPEACICADLDAVLDAAPPPPSTPMGADWGRWLKGVVRESNVGVEE